MYSVVIFVNADRLTLSSKISSTELAPKTGAIFVALRPLILQLHLKTTHVIMAAENGGRIRLSA